MYYFLKLIHSYQLTLFYWKNNVRRIFFVDDNTGWSLRNVWGSVKGSHLGFALKFIFFYIF